MALDIAYLGLGVDSDPARKASADLDRLSKSAGRAEGAAESLTAESGRLAGSTRQVSNAAKAAALSENAQSAAMKANTVATKTATAAQQQYSLSLRQIQGRQRMMMFQLNDIGTMLATGASPFQILATQGGQITQIYSGGQGGVNAALRDTATMVGGVVAKMAPLAAIVGVSAALFAGMTARINETSDASVSMGDTFKAAVQLAAEALADELNPAMEYLGPIAEEAWRIAQEATAGGINYIIRETLTMKEQIALAFAIIAESGEWAYERIVVAAQRMGVKGIEAVNSVIEAYNAVNGFGVDLQQITILNDGVEDVIPLAERINAHITEAQGRITEIATTDYAGTAFESIAKRAEKIARESASNSEEAAKAAKAAARARGQALDALSRKSEGYAQARLRGEGDVEALILRRLQVELDGLDALKDKYVKNGGDIREIEAELAQARIDLQKEADRAIFQHRTDEAEKHRREQERLERLSARSRSTIQSLTMSGAFGAPQPGAQSFGEPADYALQDSLYREQADLAALEQSRQDRLEFARSTGEDILEIERQYEEMRTAIRAQAARDRDRIETVSVRQAKQALAGEVGNLAGTLSSLVEEGSTAYRAMIAIQRSAALAQIAIAAPTAASLARSTYPPPFGEIMAAMVYANVIAESAKVAAVTFGGGREFGGMTRAGEMYEVGEKGRPELYTEGAKTYLIGGSNGRVTPEPRIPVAANDRNSRAPQIVHKHYHMHQYALSGVETDRMVQFVEEKQRETEEKVPTIMQEYEFDEARLGGRSF